MARASKASAAKKSTKKTGGAAKKAAKKTSSTATKKKAAAKKSTSAAKKQTAKAASAKKAATKKAAPAKEPARAKEPTPATKASSGGRTKKAKSPFDSRFLEQMRKSLASEREVYERQAKNLKAEADSLVADLDPGDVQFDEESGEGDTIAVERNRDLALAAKALEMIEEIDHALSKFDEGTYGMCEVSGEPIPKERLEASPWAREKVEYKVGGFGRR